MSDGEDRRSRFRLGWTYEGTMSAVASAESDHALSCQGWRDRTVRRLRVVMEAVVLTLVVLAPWAFGAVDPPYEFLLYVGVAVLLLLWAARSLVERRLAWQHCPVAVCLAALFLFGVGQLATLPQSILSHLSPATARLYDRLLPERSETLPFKEERGAAAVTPGSTLSLYPHATRQQVVRLLAVFLLFAVVRNNTASAAGLKRLSIVAFVNGTLLSLFGLVQFFTSTPNTIYWIDRTRGSVFGPFINRDHFAFYINLCVGLGVGLLLSRSTNSIGARDVANGPTPRARSGSSSYDDVSSSHLLHNPQVLWICLALALMVTSVTFCLSRGAFLALLGGTLVCLTLKFLLSPRFLHLQTVLLTFVVALSLLAWFGFERVQKRLDTLWDGQALQDDRLFLLIRSVPLVRDFPLWGTGYGTFEYIEPLYRTKPTDAGWVYEHAHNEYLEALVEGGTVRLALSLLSIGLIFRIGYRAFRRHERGPVSGLALGALFAFSTLVLHSIVEFGLHIPAIALLATVLCAQLSALGGRTQAAVRRIGTVPAPGSAGLPTFRLGGLLPAVGAAVGFFLGMVLCAEGWKADRVWRLGRIASRLHGTADSSGLERRIACLDAAARLDPSNARQHYQLGEAYSDVFEKQSRIVANGVWLKSATEAVLSAAPAAAPVTWISAPSFVLFDVARISSDKKVVKQLALQYQVPALRHYLLARDLCPLLVKPHMRIAAYLKGLASFRSRNDYLERAKFLDPSDPELWYRCGLMEKQDTQFDRAWESWRRSLQLSDRYLPEILERSRKLLSERELLAQVLPNRAAVLARAAFQMHPGTEEKEERKPFQEKVLALLTSQTEPLEAEDYYVKAAALRDLNEPREALTAYRAALLREPGRTAWRCELARLLFEQGQLQEARRELMTLLAQQPGHGEARELLDAVTSEIAKKE